MTAIATLAGIIAQRTKVSKVFCESQIGFNDLLEHGFLRISGIVQSVCCEACDETHDADVVFETDGYGHYCPDVGFVPMDESLIQAVKPDVAKLVAVLADAFECTRRKSTPVYGETWRIGTISTDAGSLTLYFHPTLQAEQDAKDLERALADEINSAYRLTFSAAGTLSVTGAKSVKLEDVFDGLKEMLTFTPSIDPRNIVDAPITAKNGRPSPYSDRLTSLIKARMQTGDALQGRNEEGRAIAAHYQAKYPNEKAPSLPTIKRHLTKMRAGS